MKLSEALEELYALREIKVSHEMIDFQRNDYIVSTLTDLFQELITEVKTTNRVSSATDMHKDGRCLEILNKIDYALLERFGLTFKHVACAGIGYGVFVSSPKEIDAISGKSKQASIEEIDEVLKYYKYNTDLSKKKEDVEVFDDSRYTGTRKEEKEKDELLGKVDNLHLLYNYRKSLEEIKSKMKTSSVFVDRKKAKIVGLPNEYIAYILHDTYTLIEKIKLSAEELTATLLHEVGHAFTYIEYSYRSVANCSVLMDTFLENLTKKNKTPKESLILSYDKYSGNKEASKELKDKNAITATLYILDNFIKENFLTLTGSTHPSVDSEQLADQFSGRFDCGENLVSALNKIEEYGIKQLKNYYLFQLGMLLVMLLINIGLVVVIGSPAMIVAGLVGVVFLLVLGRLLTFVSSYPQDNDPGYKNTYDSLKRRYARMRNEMIRNLRNIELPDKEYKERLILSIEKVDVFLNSVPDEKVGIIDSLVRFFSKSARHRVEVRLLEQLLEDLSENNLHLAAAKLQSKL